MLKTAVAYIRVSTENQAVDGVSLEAQRAKLTAWCLVNDYDLIATHTDAGLSGGRADNRPGLQAAIEQACKTKSALVVYSLSRLARSTKDTIAIGELLDKAGADLVSLSEKIDTSCAAGKMVFRMLAVLAEFEKDQISERTKMALAHKKAQGQRTGSVPFGFDLAEDGNTLMSNVIEQSALAAMREMRQSGLSYRKIAAELQTREYRTKQGKTVWKHTSVKSVLETQAA